MSVLFIPVYFSVNKSVIDRFNASGSCEAEAVIKLRFGN